MISYLGMLILVIGVFFMLTSVVGVMRFPDFGTRVHAAGIADSLGSTMIVVGLVMQCGILLTFKLLLLLCLLWVTNTTACNALVYSAYGEQKCRRK